MITRPTHGRYYVYVYFYPNGVPCYVGKGTGGRWREHLKPNGSSNIHLRAILNATGNLPVVIIREQLTRAAALAVEEALITAIGRRDLGTGPLVNLRPIGTCSAETSAKISRKLKGRIFSAEQRANMRAGHKRAGPRHFSVEARAKISAANKGKKKPPRSPEWRAKQRAAKTGKKRSAESCAKQSATLTGRKRPPEYGAAISARQRGKKHSAERIAKMRAGRWGKRN